MALECYIGPERNLLATTAAHAERLRVPHPILSNDELAALKALDHRGWRTREIDITFPADSGEAGLLEALDRICAEASGAIDAGYSLIVLSDRATGADRVPISALAAVGAVHHHLVRTHARTRIGILVETGEAREVHQHCLLIGYGADAVNPYLAFEALWDARRNGYLDEAAHVTDDADVVAAYRKGVAKGMLKVMAKMGHLDAAVLQGGADLRGRRPRGRGRRALFRRHGEPRAGGWLRGPRGGDAAPPRDRIPAARHRRPSGAAEPRGLPLAPRRRYAHVGPRGHGGPAGGGPDGQRRGVLALRAARQRGEHAPEHPARAPEVQGGRGRRSHRARRRGAGRGDRETLRDRRNELRVHLGRSPRVPRDRDEPHRRQVEHGRGRRGRGPLHAPAERRLEALGDQAGGERPLRGSPSTISRTPTSCRSRSSRARSPARGGELPGRKVDETIAAIRHSTPGVGLISPPPHHDIYSIEDIAQLIHDLKNANPSARISVKLGAAIGVGTVAAGVTKARSDHLVIAGDTGGTGASPLTSIKHAGVPWELGVAETHQTLVMNNLRSRVVLQTDGQLKTGRDVAVAALLGAEEFGFATAPLIALGCIMMRKCHLNTCPVGIATQDPELRAKFAGAPEHVVNYFFMVAEELRAIMAELGFRTVNEMIGRVDALDVDAAVARWKASGLDLTRILAPAREPEDCLGVYAMHDQDHGPRRGPRQRTDPGSRSRRSPGGKPVRADAAAQEREPRGRRHALARDHPAGRPADAPGRHHPLPVRGQCGAELRRLARARRDPRSGRRRQRLRGQGPLRGPPRHLSAALEPLPRGGAGPGRQRRPLRRHGGGVLLPGHRRRTFLRAQLGRPRGGRGRRRSRLRVHDGRPCGHPGSDGPELRRRA